MGTLILSNPGAQPSKSKASSASIPAMTGPCTAGTVFTLDTDLGRIDLLSEVAGLGGWKEIRTGCVRLPAFDREVWTLDLPSLIRAKRAAGRPKDLLVLPELESLLDAANDSAVE